MKAWKILHKTKGGEMKGIEEILEALLHNREIRTRKEIDDFLHPKLESVTLQAVGIDKIEVKKTIDRIMLAVKNNEGIVIYGDYDVDGISATAILWETIYSFYKNVHPYIPHRIDEGYGLSIQGIENSKKKIENIGLIITVDNGIVATKAVDYARKEGIDVVITDHHVKSESLPRAYSIIHTTELCGTGIAWLLSQEILNSKFEILSTEQLKSDKKITSSSDLIGIPRNDQFLELVALATVADLVPLNKFNRVLLTFGLEQLRKTKRLGLLALFDEAKIKKEEISSYHIGHMIAPRLNASGRISHALDSLRLICTTDQERARKLAQTLGEINRERQQMTLDSALHAIDRVKALESSPQPHPDPLHSGEGEASKNLIFVEDEMYEQGVIGLIASRLVEEFYRPAIAVSVGDKISKGSARSIPGVNIIDLIRSCSDLLTEAGGHPMAAGFSLKTEKLQEFKIKMISLAEKIIDKKLFEKVLKIDLELPFSLISTELYDSIQVLEPFGIGNPQPVFLSHSVTVVSANTVGKNSEHLQMVLEKDGFVFKAIKFRSGNNEAPKKGDLIDIAYTLDLNEWNGNKKVELKLKDIRHSRVLAVGN